MNDEKSSMTGTNLVSVAFYVVIIGLLMPSLQTESFTISDQFVSFFRRVRIVLTTQSVLGVFTISFYTKIVYDDLRDRRNDDRRNIGFLLAAWLLFVMQIALRRYCSISASAFVAGLCCLTIPELFSLLYRIIRLILHRRRVLGLMSCLSMRNCLELIFNIIYMICGSVFIIRNCSCAIQVASGILVFEIVLEMFMRNCARRKC